jgi:hypothetical protein
MASFLKYRLNGEKAMKIASFCSRALVLTVFVCCVQSAFGQADIARRTTAITYPPDDQINVQFQELHDFPKCTVRQR